MKTNRKYELNENYFNKIDSQEKAYFLGFLYADGYNDKIHTRFVLSLTDKEILEYLREQLETNKPIQVHISKNIKSKPLYILSIHSKQLSDNLGRLGCSQAKTHTLQFPTDEQVPKEYISHFIRGYFDGDGSLSGFRNPQFSITGNETFLNRLQIILIEECKLTKTKFNKRHKDRSNNISALVYTGVFNCKRIYDLLYKESNIQLERKREKFELLFKQKGII